MSFLTLFAILIQKDKKKVIWVDFEIVNIAPKRQKNWIRFNFKNFNVVSSP